ncbi:MAG: class I SAM-dependent methyltransferase [Aureibaculum sp.]|nr:class I SAM-dependent methyltransferase [Aureibaculum sp.]
MLKNSEFFNQLADDYNVMIDFENSLKNKITTLTNFCSTNDKYALDLGCGTGADSIALSKLGLKVDAVDHSKGMLVEAIKNSKIFNTKINFIHAGLTEFTIRNKTYDVIVSLGNTIANLNGKELKNLLIKLFEYLSKNGKIVIQIINYAKLPSSGIYILNTFENDSVSIIRKYNIKPKSIDFIIDKIEKRNNEKSQIITKLYPHSKDDLKKLVIEIGFSMEFYGNLNKSPFVTKESPNLVVVLKK